MKLSSLIDPRHVLVGDSSSNLDEAVQHALRHAEPSYRGVFSYEQALSAIRERVALGGTALPGGVAIPHARLPGYDDLLIIPVCFRNAMHTEQGLDVSIAWVVLLGSGSSGIYLKMLAGVARIAGDKALSAALVGSSSGHEFVQALEKSGIEVEKSLRVEDIMSGEPVSIGVDATVKDLLDLMAARSLRYVPVLDSDKRLVGEIGVLDVIDAAIPDYARRVGKLNFLGELEPIDEFLEREATMSVRSVMKKPAGVLAPGDSLVAVAVAMAKQRKRHFPVVAGERLVGIVSSMDILFKVLRA